MLANFEVGFNLSSSIELNLEEIISEYTFSYLLFFRYLINELPKTIPVIAAAIPAPI